MFSFTKGLPSPYNRQLEKAGQGMPAVKSSLIYMCRTEGSLEAPYTNWSLKANLSH